MDRIENDIKITDGVRSGGAEPYGGVVRGVVFVYRNRRNL